MAQRALPVLLWASCPFGSQASWSSLGWLGAGHLGAAESQPYTPAHRDLSIIPGLHQSALLRLDQSFISLSHHLPFLFVPGMSWSSHLLLAAQKAGDSSSVLQKLLKLWQCGFCLTLCRAKCCQVQVHTKANAGSGSAPWLSHLSHHIFGRELSG